MKIVEAAIKLDLSESRVRKMIGEGKIRAEKVNGMWDVDAKSIDEYKKKKPKIPEGEELLEMYYEAGSIRRLAQQLGCNRNTIRTRLPQIGSGKYPKNSTARKELQEDRFWDVTKRNLENRGIYVSREEACPNDCPWGLGGGMNVQSCLSLEGCPLLEGSDGQG